MMGVWVGGVDKSSLMCYIGEMKQVDTEFWTTCPQCKLRYNQLDHPVECPSLICATRRVQLRKATAGGRWWQCHYCRRFYQAHEKLKICPTCQAKHDAAVERDRRELEAMKGQPRIGG